MFGLGDADDCRPITWFGKVPVYLTTFLAIAYALGLVFTTIASSASLDVSPLILDPRALLHGAVWQPLTYTFIQPVSFFSFLNILFFYSMGMQVESYVGRRTYLALYLAVLLLPAVLSLLVPWVGYSLYSGSFFVGVGFFIAFATLYPGVEWFGFLQAKWLALIGIVLGSMAYVGAHDWGKLTLLLSTCGYAFGHIRILQFGGIRVVISDLAERIRPAQRPAPRARSRIQTEVRPEVNESGDVVESIDPLLEKISKHGLESLTPKERQRLEEARLALLRKR